MKRLFLPTSSLVLAVGLATARVPDNLVTEGLPAIPLELRAGRDVTSSFALPHSTVGIRGNGRCSSRPGLPILRSFIS